MVRKKIILTISICITISILNLQAKILTLSEAENRAITTGYEARAKHFEEQAKEWEKRNTIAKYLPTIDYSLNFMRMDDSTIFYTNIAMDMIQSQFPDIDMSRNLMYKNNFSHEISINQPIYNGGVEIAAIKIAKHMKKAIDLQMEASTQEDIYITRKAYFDALFSIERTKVARQDLSWNTQNLHNARIKHKAGSVPITDVLQWEAEVLKKESDVLEAEATEKFLILSLYKTMGIPPDKHISYQLQPFESFEMWYKKGSISTNDSIKNNYQLMSVKAYTKVAEENKRIVLSSALPKLNAYCKYSKDQGWVDINDIIDKPRTLTAGAILTVPLFSGLKSPTSYQKSKYEYMKTVIEEKQIETQLKVNLERIKLFYKASYEAVKAAKKQQELMEKQLDIMQKRYDGGLVNQSQLLEVSLGTSQTRIGYIQKLFNCLLYEAEYLKNVGKLEVTQ